MTTKCKYQVTRDNLVLDSINDSSVDKQMYTVLPTITSPPLKGWLNRTPIFSLLIFFQLYTLIIFTILLFLNNRIRIKLATIGIFG